jgi:hypothetical protein
MDIAIHGLLSIEISVRFGPDVLAVKLVAFAAVIIIGPGLARIDLDNIVRVGRIGIRKFKYFF